MKCYNYNEVDVLGTCKACSKGICKQCLTDVGNGIACTATCIEEVEQINQLVEKNKTIYKRTAKANIRRGIFYSITGFAFIFINLQTRTDDNFLFFVGTLLIFLGFYSAYTGYTQNKN